MCDIIKFYDFYMSRSSAFLYKWSKLFALQAQRTKINPHFSFRSVGWGSITTSFTLLWKLLGTGMSKIQPSSVHCWVWFLSKKFNKRFHRFRFSFSDEIYDCEKTFERLFLGAIFGSNAPYFIAGWRSDFKDQVKLKITLRVVRLRKYLIYTSQ